MLYGRFRPAAVNCSSGVRAVEWVGNPANWIERLTLLLIWKAQLHGPETLS